MRQDTERWALRAAAIVQDSVRRLSRLYIGWGALSEPIGHAHQEQAPGKQYRHSLLKIISHNNSFNLICLRDSEASTFISHASGAHQRRDLPQSPLFLRFRR